MRLSNCIMYAYISKRAYIRLKQNRRRSNTISWNPWLQVCRHYMYRIHVCLCLQTKYIGLLISNFVEWLNKSQQFQILFPFISRHCMNKGSITFYDHEANCSGKCIEPKKEGGGTETSVCDAPRVRNWFEGLLCEGCG